MAKNGGLRLSGMVSGAVITLFCQTVGWASPAPVDPPAAMNTRIIAHASIPQGLEPVLQSTDAHEAAKMLWQYGCGPNNSEWTLVVERAWERRESGPPDAATRDPVVRALMAKCLAEPWSRFRSTQPSDLPIIAELRQAILSDNSEEVRAAASGLTHFATAEDVQTLIAVPGRLPGLERSIVAALSEVCRAEAAQGISKIRGTVTDPRDREDIDRIAKGLVPTRRLVCRFDVNIIGNPISQADIDDFWVPSHTASGGASAREIAEVLESSNVQSARKMLEPLRCLPSERTGIDAVQSAWRTRDSAPPESVTRDAAVRASMAVCLAEASAASHTALDPSVAAELRKSIKSEDLVLRIYGMEGLSRIATGADIGLIVDAAKVGPAILAGVAVAELSTTCAPGAADAAENLREWTTKPMVREQIDFDIRSTERIRAVICGVPVVDPHGRGLRAR